MSLKTVDLFVQVNSKKTAGILWNVPKLVIGDPSAEQISSNQDQTSTNQFNDLENSHKHNNVNHKTKGIGLLTLSLQSDNPGRRLGDHRIPQI